MLWGCPICPDLASNPFGWLRFRLIAATEVNTVEWWQRENLVFVSVAGTVALLIALAAIRYRRDISFHPTS